MGHGILGCSQDLKLLTDQIHYNGLVQICRLIQLKSF